jgi:hypothetical protein
MQRRGAEIVEEDAEKKEKNFRSRRNLLGFFTFFLSYLGASVVAFYFLELRT